MENESWGRNEHPIERQSGRPKPSERTFIEHPPIVKKPLSPEKPIPGTAHLCAGTEMTLIKQSVESYNK